MAFDFVKALINTFVNFLFAYVNIQLPTFALVANKTIWINYDFMQIRKAFKIFEPQYIGQKNGIVCISVKDIRVFVWENCGSDVIVIYDVMEH